MSSGHVQQAVILAAGLGSRIRKDGQPLPKPLVQVGGLSLLKRTILTSRQAGIKRFVIVVGCEGQRVRDEIGNDPELANLELVWVENEQYRLKNGVSVLAARPHIRGEFLLMMSDHVVDVRILRTLQEEPARGGLVLAVDRKLDTIFDMDDATKVKIGERDAIIAIGKELPEYDAIDTGVFRCDPALFEALDAVFARQGDASLSEGVQALAAVGKARVADVGPAWWQDVDDLPSRKHAEKLLFKALTKVTDGPVSRHINRKFSKTCTRALMNLPVVPNHMTAVGLVVGVAAALVTAFATPASVWMLALGGVLYQVSSMLDGCDGEIARLKYQHSASGEWFDTISDDVINLGYQLSLGVALFNFTGQHVWLQIGIATFVVGWFVALVLYRKLLANGKGTHLALEWSFQKQENSGLFARFCERMEFIAHRDVYALILMFLTIAGVFQLTVLKVAAVLSAITVGIVFSQWVLTTLAESAARRDADRRLPQPE